MRSGSNQEVRERRSRLYFETSKFQHSRGPGYARAWLCDRRWLRMERDSHCLIAAQNRSWSAESGIWGDRVEGKEPVGRRFRRTSIEAVQEARQIAASTETEEPRSPTRFVKAQPPMLPPVSAGREQLASEGSMSPTSPLSPRRVGGRRQSSEGATVAASTEVNPCVQRALHVAHNHRRISVGSTVARRSSTS